MPVNVWFYEITCSQEIFAIVRKQLFLLFIMASEKERESMIKNIFSNAKTSVTYTMTPSKPKDECHQSYNFSLSFITMYLLPLFS